MNRPADTASIPFEEFCKRLESVRLRIGEACRAAGREASSVQLLPVTKTHSANVVEYVQKAGLSAVGENRVQEAVAKQVALGDSIYIGWELIGHLQSNKARQAAAHFDRIQSLDSAKLLQRLDQQAREIGKKLPVLLQINAGNDPAKHGVLPDAVEPFLEAALGAGNLAVEGLMTIAPLDGDPAVARRTFETLRNLRDRLADSFGVPLRELSMGMTGDLEEAVAAGSTCVRVGTALFGTRGHPA